MKNKFDIEDRWNEEYRQGAHWERRVGQATIDFSKSLKNDIKILDAGCGSGRDSVYFDSLGHTVYSIDLSPVAIEKAKAKNNNISFKLGNLEKLPYSDNMFDALYCGYVLSVTIFSKTIKELARVLKVGGVGCIACLYRTEYPSNTFFNNIIELDLLLNSFNKYFEITFQNIDSYWEEDQHGNHMHKRLIVYLKK